MGLCRGAVFAILGCVATAFVPAQQFRCSSSELRAVNVDRRRLGSYFVGASTSMLEAIHAEKKAERNYAREGGRMAPMRAQWAEDEAVLKPEARKARLQQKAATAKLAFVVSGLKLVWKRRR